MRCFVPIPKTLWCLGFPGHHISRCDLVSIACGHLPTNLQRVKGIRHPWESARWTLSGIQHLLYSYEVTAIWVTMTSPYQCRPSGDTMRQILLLIRPPPPIALPGDITMPPFTPMFPLIPLITNSPIQSLLCSLKPQIISSLRPLDLESHRWTVTWMYHGSNPSPSPALRVGWVSAHSATPIHQM